MVVMNNAYTVQKTVFYKIEPGDGTRYTFSITWLDGDAHRVIGGIHSGEYMCLAIHMSGIRGSYEVRADSIRRPIPPYVDYFVNHAGNNLDRYTCAAVILAASVLVDESANIDRAAEKMLQAPQFLER